MRRNCDFDKQLDIKYRAYMFHILKRLKISLEDDDVSRVCLKQGIPTWIRNYNLEFGIWNPKVGPVTLAKRCEDVGRRW